MIYPLKPVAHAISTENPLLFMAPGFSPWVSNGRIEQNSFKKRPGYYLDRSPLRQIYGIYLYQTLAGSRYTLYLTDTDLIKKETGTSETFSYITRTYTTGSVSSISTVTVEGNGTTWSTNVSAGDKFVLAADLTTNVEPDSSWRTVSSVTDNDTLVLTSAYSGGSSGDYIIRHLYSVPSEERWSTCVVNDKFVFTNGDVDLQYWGGSNYAVPLDTTYASKARYCIEYANRLFIADYYTGATRYPTSIRWSKEGDITDWTDSTAGMLDLIESEDYITGLGKVGADLVIYKRENLYIYTRSGIATSPIRIVGQRRGIGCVAPYSIIEFMGTNAFIGRDDFYVMNSDQPEPIGTKIRTKFFDITEVTELEKSWGGHDPIRNEIFWVVNTTEGKYVFVFNYKYKEWYTYTFDGDVTGFGRGAL